jgi:hypothetical protein
MIVGVLPGEERNIFWLREHPAEQGIYHRIENDVVGQGDSPEEFGVPEQNVV